MKPLAVDFAAPRRVSPWLWGGLAFAFVVLAADQAWQAWGLQQQLSAMEQQAATLSEQLRRAQQIKDEAEARARIEPPYARDAAAVARMAGFPLNRMLTALEHARVQGIKLTALDISAEEGAVRAELEYADNEALMRYLEELNVGEPTPRWRLMQAQNGSGVGATNSASIASTWNATDQ